MAVYVVHYMTFRFRALAVMVIAGIFCAGCMSQNVPSEEDAIEWEEQARAYESASEWEKAADAWGEAAEAWENQADVLEDAGDLAQACEARENAALDLEAKAESYSEAREWRKAVRAYKRAAEVWEIVAEGWESVGYINKPRDALMNAAHCWFAIGLADVWLNDCDEMTEAYEKAANLSERAGYDEIAEFYRELDTICE